MVGVIYHGDFGPFAGCGRGFFVGGHGGMMWAPFGLEFQLA